MKTYPAIYDPHPMSDHFFGNGNFGLVKKIGDYIVGFVWAAGMCYFCRKNSELALLGLRKVLTDFAITVIKNER